MKRIVVFASGAGSNAENCIHYFNTTSVARVTHVVCNRKNAAVFERCKKLDIPCLYFNKDAFFEEDTLLAFLKKEADFIVLAGFLLKVPEKIIAAFPQKIINIHPALLPKYGGKGMYGIHIHKAVKANEEPETGITIHYVDEQYDEGTIIFQASIKLSKEDTPDRIAEKVHALEYRHFPKVIEQVIINSNG